LTASVPHESTVRKLARRIGPDVIDEITRLRIAAAVREKRFAGPAMRVDSTVVEADVRWPSDAALAHDATRALAREGARVGALVGAGARRKLAAADRLDELADRAEKVSRQITQRVAGEKITDRLVSLADPDARPIGKGKLGKRYEFGYVFQLAEITENTRRGARGLILCRHFPAPRAGFEPATCGLEVRCSIRLSYRGLRRVYERCVTTRCACIVVGWIVQT